MTIPNGLTLTRIGLIPLLVLAFYWPFAHHQWYAAGIFGVAALTDWLDGYLARRFDQGTPFGAFLDPVADKLIVVTALLLLVERQAEPLFTLAACIIIGREVLVSALREWMAQLGRSDSVAVSALGKLKTLVQMLAILLLLLVEPGASPGWVVTLAEVLIALAALLALYSMGIYIHAALRVVDKEKN